MTRLAFDSVKHNAQLYSFDDDIKECPVFPILCIL